MKNADGSPMQLFEKVATSGYDWDPATQEWKYREEDPRYSDSLYTIGNMRINKELLQSPSKLGFKKPDGKVDYETAEKLKAAFTEEAYTLNEELSNMIKFQNAFNASSRYINVIDEMLEHVLTALGR